MKGRDRRASRRAADDRWALLETGVAPETLGHDDTGTPLHDERLDAVVAALAASGARTVLDLGCGGGALLRRLAAREQFTRIVGVDTSPAALRAAGRSVAAGEDGGGARIAVRYGSFTEVDERLKGFDAAAMVETIEHVDPGELSRVEAAVFGGLRPSMVVITTPNREYNVRYGLADGALRHPDHRFEWTRAKFGSWARGVGERNGYGVTFEALGPPDPLLGSPTQMALFRIRSPET